MTLIVENGTIVTSANSYISTANFTTYATARGYTLVNGAETLLIQAMDYLENLKYVGIKRTRDQPLVWPRLDVYIDGYYQDSTAIPQQLINGQCEIAMAIDAGNGPLIDLPIATKREKVGPIEVEYATNASATIINRKIKNALWKILATGGNGSNVLNVTKA